MRSRNENTNVTKGKPSPKLVLVSGKGERQYSITREETVIGRSPDCDIVINDSSISRQHAKIVYLGGAFFIYDNESLNGTQVNGRKISESKIEDGNLIRIGDSEFRFEYGISQKIPSSCAPKGSGPKRTEPPFKNTDGKRFKTYAVALAVLIVVLVTMFALKKSKRPAIEPLRPGSTEFAPDYEGMPLDGKSMANIDTNEAARYYDLGLMAMMSGNLNSAMSYFELALQKQPMNAAASKKLKECRKLLMKKIEETYDSGIREFNIMQYDRAILEWNKVVLMAKGFDDEMLKKAGEKILEAEKTKAKLSKR